MSRFQVIVYSSGACSSEVDLSARFEEEFCVIHLGNAAGAGCNWPADSLEGATTDFWIQLNRSCTQVAFQLLEAPQRSRY